MLIMQPRLGQKQAQYKRILYQGVASPLYLLRQGLPLATFNPHPLHHLLAFFKPMASSTKTVRVQYPSRLSPGLRTTKSNVYAPLHPAMDRA